MLNLKQRRGEGREESKEVRVNRKTQSRVIGVFLLHKQSSQESAWSVLDLWVNLEPWSVNQSCGVGWGTWDQGRKTFWEGAWNPKQLVGRSAQWEVSTSLVARRVTKNTESSGKHGERRDVENSTFSLIDHIQFFIFINNLISRVRNRRETSFCELKTRWKNNLIEQ